MIHPDDDGSAIPNYDHFKSLAERRKLRPVMKSRNICFKRSRGELHINNLSGPTTTDLSRSGVYYKSPLEDSELKLTLMNLIPRNTAQETSEGVQELIKHVSEFIGKKNPFMDGSSGGRKEKNEPTHSSRHSMRSRSSKDTLHSSRKPKSTSEDRKVSKTVQSAADKCCRDTVVSPKSEPESKSLSYANRRCLEIRKRLLQPDSKSESTEGNEAKEKSSLKSGRNTPTKENTEKSEPHTQRRVTKVSHKTEPGKSPTAKKLKPSEIPLRKNRPVSKVKQTSSVAMKTVKEANITTSVHVNTNHRSGTNNTHREIRNRSRETDKENPESSSTRQMFSKDKVKTAGKDGEKCDADNNKDVHLSKSVKNPNVAELSSNLSKVRMLDLEQVRSSTFTVLTTLSNTFHRLESIHQQNIGLKENGSEKILCSKSSKLKILTPKPSYNLLKAKGSKKNLSSRLSSKGNKPGLKHKIMKSKTEVETNRTSTLPENVKTGSRERSRGGNSPLPLHGDTPTPKRENSVKEKQNEKTTTAKKTDEISRGSSFSKPKTITRKVASPKNQSSYGTTTGFNQKLLVSLCHTTLDKLDDDFKSLRKDPIVKNNNESSKHISSMSSPEGWDTVTTPIGRKMSNAVIIEGLTKTKPALSPLIEEQHKVKKREPSNSEAQTKAKPRDQTKVKKPKESSRLLVRDLKVVGTAVKLPEERTPAKPKEPESDKVQLRITIDVNSQEDCSFTGKNITEEGKNVCSFNWLFMNHRKCGHECGQQLNDTKDRELLEITTMKEIIRDPASPPLDDTFTESVRDELAVSKELETGLEQHYRGGQMMKRRSRPKYKTPVINVETIGKKVKTRSETGNRWFLTSTGHFNSAIHLQNNLNKTKADTKLRSGLTRSFNRNANISSERRDHFDDSNSANLKRRNSEPFSFRGFIWRHQDAVLSRSNKASVSSLGSSLKHLNTDDLEDFIFWESVPPRATSCWETSLYHFKRPWSVLSCSVFKDNRLSNTPGIILENIRNGNCSARRWPALQETERVSNSFDVEPSITQKNIDVRNWLAALNFQSPPSTSSDVIREGSVSAQTVTLSQDFDIPVVQKHRKVFPELKLSESSETKSLKGSDKFNSEGSDIGLMELIRRKSGGFVTAEQYFNSNHRSQSYASRVKSNPRQKSKLSFHVLEDLEDSDVEKVTESEPNIPKEEKMIQVAFEDFVSPPSCPSVEVLEKPSSGQDKEATPHQGSRFLTLKKFLRGDTEVVTSNVWKYLFMFTLFVLLSYYVSRSSHSCPV